MEREVSEKAKVAERRVISPQQQVISPPPQRKNQSTDPPSATSTFKRRFSFKKLSMTRNKSNQTKYFRKKYYFEKLFFYEKKVQIHCENFFKTNKKKVRTKQKKVQEKIDPSKFPANPYLLSLHFQPIRSFFAIIGASAISTNYRHLSQKFKTVC